VEGEGGSCESRLVLSVVEVGLLVLFPTSCDGNYMSEITWVKFGVSGFGTRESKNCTG
jgi:hypothetical protein